MLVGKVSLKRDRLWPAGVVAFVTHGFVITALALNMIPSKMGRPQLIQDKFCVEMVFDQEADNEPIDGCQGLEPEETPEPITQLSAETISFKKPLSKSVQSKSYEEKKASGSLVISMPPTSGANSSQPLFNPPPVYPREARRRKIQGVVMVRASLSEEGAVASAITLAPRMDPILEDAALRAIHQWRFKPGVRTVEVPIEFKLVV